MERGLEDMSSILKVEDLVKYYGEGENQVRAVDHTSLQIERGKFTAIVGRSGSGKSTLLHLIGGLDRPDSGKYGLMEPISILEKMINWHSFEERR